MALINRSFTMQLALPEIKVIRSWMYLTVLFPKMSKATVPKWNRPSSLRWNIPNSFSRMLTGIHMEVFCLFPKVLALSYLQPMLPDMIWQWKASCLRLWRIPFLSHWPEASPSTAPADPGRNRNYPEAGTAKRGTPFSYKKRQPFTGNRRCADGYYDSENYNGAGWAFYLTPACSFFVFCILIFLNILYWRSSSIFSSIGISFASSILSTAWDGSMVWYGRNNPLSSFGFIIL